MGTLHEDQCTFLILSHLVLTRMRSVSDKHRENQNTHIMSSNFFFPLQKSYSLWDSVKKYCRARQATVAYITHVLCMLDNSGYKHTLTIYVICIAFPLYSGSTNAPECYIVRTLPVLFKNENRLFWTEGLSEMAVTENLA